MTIQQTYDILKYGPIYPQKVRNIINEYFELTPNLYFDGWEPYNNVGISDGQIATTHFMDICVYYNDINNSLEVALIVNDEDQLEDVKKHYITVNNYIIMDITSLNPDQITHEFHELFEDVYRICQYKEWNDNYPDDSFEH